MTYTEEEAKTRWCPFARVVESGAVNSYNRSLSSDCPPAARCIGSACMAFRCAAVTNYGQPVVDENGDQVFSSHAGYCGLAGKP